MNDKFKNHYAVGKFKTGDLLEDLIYKDYFYLILSYHDGWYTFMNVCKLHGIVATYDDFEYQETRFRKVV